MRKVVRKGDSDFFITSTAMGDLGDADHWPVSREAYAEVTPYVARLLGPHMQRDLVPNGFVSSRLISVAVPIWRFPPGTEGNLRVDEEEETIKAKGIRSTEVVENSFSLSSLSLRLSLSLSPSSLSLSHTHTHKHTHKHTCIHKKLKGVLNTNHSLY